MSCINFFENLEGIFDNPINSFSSVKFKFNDSWFTLSSGYFKVDIEKYLILLLITLIFAHRVIKHQP